MPMATRTLAALGLIVAAAAPMLAQRRSDVIAAEEIERIRANAATAFDVVQTLRPRWLKSREVVMSGRSPESQMEYAPVHVYLNDVDAGGTDYLKTILAENVESMRWLSANHASSRYGPTDGPAIVVTLKR